MNEITSKTKQTIKVSCCIIIYENKALILRRDHNGPRNGLWEFPGGKEENETAVECAIREVYEEIEYKIDKIKFIAEVFKEYKDINIKLSAYVSYSGRIFTPKLKVHDKYKWELISQLDKSIFPKANQDIIDILINNGY